MDLNLYHSYYTKNRGFLYRDGCTPLSHVQLSVVFNLKHQVKVGSYKRSGEETHVITFKEPDVVGLREIFEFLDLMRLFGPHNCPSAYNPHKNVIGPVISLRQSVVTLHFRHLKNKFDHVFSYKIINQIINIFLKINIHKFFIKMAFQQAIKDSRTEIS